MSVDFAKAALAAGHAVVASGRDSDRVSGTSGRPRVRSRARRTGDADGDARSIVTRRAGAVCAQDVGEIHPAPQALGFFSQMLEGRIVRQRTRQHSDLLARESGYSSFQLSVVGVRSLSGVRISGVGRERISLASRGRQAAHQSAVRRTPRATSQRGRRLPQRAVSRTGVIAGKTSCSEAVALHRYETRSRTAR